jgi:hypothetical protein
MSKPFYPFVGGPQDNPQIAYDTMRLIHRLIQESMGMDGRRPQLTDEASAGISLYAGKRGPRPE